jgi:Metallo-beta-lactamase superfamily
MIATPGNPSNLSEEFPMSVSAPLTLSRRGFCICCAVAAGLGTNRDWLKPAQAFAEARNIIDTIRDAAATMPIVVHKLRGDVAVIEGSGGNIAVLTGEDGKLFVDAGITATRPRILEAVHKLSRDPIKHLINTHWHFDHTDGNQWLNEEGAAILAHENTHKHLLTAQNVDDWDYRFPSPPLAAVPTEVFSTEKSININRSTLNLKYSAQRIRTATSRSTSSKLIFSTAGTLAGTASIRSSTIRPVGTLTE